MQLLVQDALTIHSSYADQGVPLILLTDHRIRTGEKDLRFPRGTRFNADVASVFEEGAVTEGDFVFTEKLYAALVETFPQKFRHPFAGLTFIDLDKTIAALTHLNRKSGRIRTIISQMELYRKSGSLIEVLLEFGEMITPDRWNTIKAQVDKKQRFDISFSESGIIVFVDLRPGGDEYLQRFYRNSDLVTSLVGHRRDERIKIAPDFIREMDVFTVDDPESLLDAYQTKNARLIIIGDVLSDDYKAALSQVKQYDPFARFMLATNIDQGHLDEFLLQVRNSYLADNFDIDDY